MKKLLSFVVAGFMVMSGIQSSMGQAIIVSTGGGSSVALGVNELGHLNVAGGSDLADGDTLFSPGPTTENAGYVGLAFYMGDSTHTTGYYDSTAPGCLCEGWGVSHSGTTSGYANEALGTGGLTLDSFTTGAETITSKVSLTDGSLSVEHAYGVAIAGSLFESKVKITNNTGATVTDVKYVRVMDWDVPFTEFSEYVTIAGTGTTTLLERSHNNGFNTADPLGGDGSLDGSTEDVDFTDLGPSDHGAYFRFNFGSLLAGESYEFSIFYGAAADEATMLANLGSVDIELYSLGQSDGGQTTGEPATFAFGFAGVGGDSIIPEPATLAIWSFGIGLGAVIMIRRRRKVA